MIPVRDALELILKEIRPLRAEKVDIGSTLGRVLAEDVLAFRPNPPWDNSAMDGYALRAVDALLASKETPVRLKVIYDLPAGKVSRKRVGKGEAVRIMTGAPVPQGADAVVMVENTEAGPDSTVFIRSRVREGDNIRRSGEDFQKGDTVLKKGSVIRPADILMLATTGRAEVKVYRRPTVSVLSTGDELTEIGERPGKGKIPNSNGYALSALVEECGGVPVQLGIARDNRKSLFSKLKRAVKADCVITSGGVSVGDYDLVKDVLEEMGSAMRFWKVAIKPGKPLAFGVIGGRPAFGLPGNPISSMVAFEEFVRPALLKMTGRSEIFRKTFPARITKDVAIKPGRMNFLRGSLTVKDGEYTVAPLEGQGSGIVSTMVAANAFIIVEPSSTGFKEGDTVRVQPFDPAVFMSPQAGY